MSAPERIPPRSVTPVDLLTDGELTVRGRIREASNAALLCTVALDGREASCVYKPVAGARPLWDFPDGTLAQREVAAYEVSEATGWGLVPPDPAEGEASGDEPEEGRAGAQGTGPGHGSDATVGGGA